MEMWSGDGATARGAALAFRWRMLIAGQRSAHTDHVLFFPLVWLTSPLAGFFPRHGGCSKR